ncbi:pantetheine-phosphate adenylyltransferase [Candidatus Erwinia haradaeae]|uniref:Phosphopantetheine adenylyltransferase n=1 Tax=Candidatus Erwinia haradaeae TaxID=1922217 RepID=A0A451DKN0_9GAMM|nr:pantetheine-phosphate adenylyltransferase [Candidatus Erwinia haradaeae]VFP87290.1 Phosphopantetheine adenylyltransferase [Candidatus Erwinia haradaeae]
MREKAIYPGTFDPITNGHLDIVTRAAKIFEKIILAIADNPKKKTMFSLEERENLAQETVKHLPNVSVIKYSNLLVNFAKEQKVHILIRGLRTISDLEYERKIAAINHLLAPNIESIFFMTTTQHAYLSSSLIKEIAEHGADVQELLPTPVHQAFKVRLFMNTDR